MRTAILLVLAFAPAARGQFTQQTENAENALIAQEVNRVLIEDRKIVNLQQYNELCLKSGCCRCTISRADILLRNYKMELTPQRREQLRSLIRQNIERMGLQTASERKLRTSSPWKPRTDLPAIPEDGLLESERKKEK